MAPLSCVTFAPACAWPALGPLIRKYLLDNGHRVTVELRPDQQLAEQIESSEQQRLQTARSGMADGDLQAVVAATEVCEVWGAGRGCLPLERQA